MRHTYTRGLIRFANCAGLSRMFEGGGSEDVDLLSIVAPIVCFKASVFGPCFIVQCSA